MIWNTYQSIALIWIGVAVLVFFVLLKVTAPYGRHTSVKWGTMIPNHIGWILMELPVLLVLYGCILTSPRPLDMPSRVMIFLFSVHYIYRAIIYPWRLRTRKKKMPLVITGSAIGFNLMNGFLMGYFFTRFAAYEDTWLSDPRFWIGLLLFAGGLGLNWASDQYLLQLRKPGEVHYSIPNGRLFRWISCPNHFGEIVEWLGFAILTWSLPGLAFFMWTVANLVPRALAHHKWYRKTFETYPSDRKAVVPFLL